MTELKPCPFCGNKEIIVTSKFVAANGQLAYKRYNARCKKCEASGPVITGYVKAFYWVSHLPNRKYFTNEELIDKTIKLWNGDIQ